MYLRNFQPNIEIDDNTIRKCFHFAQGMRGNHKPNFQGGAPRDEREIFINDFQGKVAEFAVEKYIKTFTPQLNIQSEIDLRILPREK